MDWPRIIYHSTDGVKTPYGYTYRKCDNQTEFDKFFKNGWRLTIEELDAEPNAGPELIPNPTATEFEPVTAPISGLVAKKHAGGRPRKVK